MIKTAPLGLKFIVFVAVFLIVHLLRLIGEYSIIQILINKSLRKTLRMYSSSSRCTNNKWFNISRVTGSSLTKFKSKLTAFRFLLTSFLFNAVFLRAYDIANQRFFCFLFSNIMSGYLNVVVFRKLNSKHHVSFVCTFSKTCPLFQFFLNHFMSSFSKLYFFSHKLPVSLLFYCILPYSHYLS